MKYSCCIEMLFTEYDFPERIRKAKEAGFDCVEFWCWENKDLDAIEAVQKETGMESWLSCREIWRGGWWIPEILICIWTV